MNNHVTVLEIDANALQHNLAYFKGKLQPQTKILAVVKAFAYGSDAIEVAKLLEKQVAYFSVAYADEGISLREAGIKTPILVFHPQLQNLERIVAYGLEPALYNFDTLDAFLNLADKAPLMNYPIHIKFNTGLNRIGFWHTDIPAILSAVKASNNIKVQSIFSHLAASEDLKEQQFTLEQINNFAYIVKQFYDHLGYEPMIHILNTSGVLNYPQAQFDMVRIGIGLYGFGNNQKETSKLKNVFTLKSIISQIHNIRPGETVGYNREFVAKQVIQSATIPVGHSDGIFRQQGNGKGYVLINGKKAPIIGNICMDMLMVEVTQIDCKQGDEVILFDNQEMVEDMANICDTIPYEIITAISARIKRLVRT